MCWISHGTSTANGQINECYEEKFMGAEVVSVGVVGEGHLQTLNLEKKTTDDVIEKEERRSDMT